MSNFVKKCTITFDGEGHVFSWDGGWEDYEALGALELAKADILNRVGVD